MIAIVLYITEEYGYNLKFKSVIGPIGSKAEAEEWLRENRYERVVGDCYSKDPEDHRTYPQAAITEMKPLDH